MGVQVLAKEPGDRGPDGARDGPRARARDLVDRYIERRRETHTQRHRRGQGQRRRETGTQGDREREREMVKLGLLAVGIMAASSAVEASSNVHVLVGECAVLPCHTGRSSRLLSSSRPMTARNTPLPQTLGRRMETRRILRILYWRTRL